MDWLCCFCRPTESEDLSRETEGILREGDTAEPSDSVPAAVSDPFRRGDDPALNEPSGAVRSAVSSRSSSEGCLDERRPPAVDRPSSTPTGGLEVSRCVVDGRSPPSPSPFFSSVIDGPSSTSVPPHESLASPTLSGIKPDVRQLPSPATSKPSASAAPQSGLFQSFAQTPFSQERNPCARASCLYNKPGRLCTIFDQRYVYIGHKDTFILVELKRRISCGLLLGTRLVWKQRKPHLLSDLADGANVVCDALSLPDTHGFHALVVWQGTKPNLIEEPAEEGEVMMLERYDLQVTGIEASEGGGGSMDVDIKGKSLKVKFMEEVVFVDGQRSSIIDIFTSFYKFNYSVFATVHKVLAGGSGENLSYICSCIWTGTRPTADLLVKIEQGDIFNKNESGTYVKCTASQSVYCDLPAILKTSDQGRQIVLRYGDEVRHLPVRNDDIFYESERNLSPLPPETTVLAHILSLKGGNRPCVLKVIGVHLTRGSTHKSRASKSNENEKVLNFISETKEISKQSKSEVKQFVDCEMNVARKKENSQIEHDQEKGKIQSENNQRKGKIQPKKVDSVHEKKDIFQKKTPVTEEKHERKDISVEDCIWHYGSISQGIAMTLQKSVLITYDVLYINGQRIPATDTVANYSEKGSTVSVAAVPLVPPCQVLGVTVTHKALAAWQGTKPECVEEIVEAYASGSDVQPGTRVIPETEIQRSVSCDRVTNSAPSLHQNHAATENMLESCCVEYIAAYRWKIAGISQGLLCRKSRVVLVKHEVFFVNKLRVPNTDPLSKFADIESKESFVNALVVPVSSPQVILGHNVTHEALVAWSGKKPDEANSYVEEYSKEKGKRSHTPNSAMKTSSLQEIGNTTRALLNPTDGKISSTEKIKFSGKDETKGSVSAVVASGLPKAKPTTNRKPEPTPKKKVPDKQPQKKTKPRHGQGKLQKVVGDHGILEIRCKNIEGERAMVAFHRSVTFLYQRRVDPKKGLEEQLSPHQADGKDFFCHFIDHGMNMGGVACQYKATMVWLGTKPKTVKEQAAETHVDKSQSTEKNNKAPGALRIQNAAGTLAHATSQVAVLKVNNVALKDGTAFVFVKGTDVYVHQRRLQDASEMTRHLIWQCNIRAWKKPSTPVKGFVCHYQAELAWVGKRPKRDDGKSSADNSQEGPVKAKKIPLLPTPGLPRIENAQTTLVYVKGQRAVLRVNNMTKLPLYASAHYTNAYVLREKVQNPNDMLRHNHWNCNLKKCDQSGLSVDGFVYQYEAELAWVGERPSQGGKDGGSQTSLGEGLESLSSMYEDLFPVIGPEDNTKIVNL
ncbi:uncharacterized protein [Penaeus vannamei]|uniref:uncharacterized protein n=1 Tax=Penaeus vannamei TaxID=6689 RepID=UPI00387F5DDA